MSRRDADLPPGLTPKEAGQLIKDAAREQLTHLDILLPIQADLPTAMVLIASLQLALRHPGNYGAAARGAREIIDALITRIEAEGLPACARLARLGNNRAQDI